MAAESQALCEDGAASDGGIDVASRRSASHAEVRKPKFLVEMERRADERRQVREGRLQRQRQQQEQEPAADQPVQPGSPSGATPHGAAPSVRAQAAEDSSTRRPEVRRSKVVVEMEQRAEERQRVWEERRQWHRQKEEQKLADERAADDARRLQEEEEKRQQIHEQRERKRAEQRRHAEKLVAAAQQRKHVREAYEFWMRNRLVDVWCAFRQLVIESDEMQLTAWCCYRQALQRTMFSAWRQQQLHDRGAREACYIARARQADWHCRRHAFRTLVAFFRLFVQRNEWQVVTARNLLAQSRAKRGVGRWKVYAANSSFEKRNLAMRQYSKGLVRCAIKWWLAGARQSRLDAELEFHKQALHKKVSGWLQEIDVSGPALRAGVATFS